MTQRKAAVSGFLLLSLTLLSSVGLLVFGWQKQKPVAPEKLHPAEPVLFYVWDGTAAHEKTWKATAAHHSLVESGLVDIVHSLISHGLEVGQVPAREELESLVEGFFTQGFSISASMDMVSGQPAPQVIIVFHNAAKNFAKLEALIPPPLLAQIKTEKVGGRSIKRMPIPETTGFEAGWWKEGEHLVVAGGLNAIELANELASGKAKNITSNAVYQQLRKADSKEIDITSLGWLDFAPILTWASPLEIPTQPGQPGIKVSEIAELLGVERLGKMRSRAGYRGKEMWSESHIDAPAPRKGLLSLGGNGQLTLKDLPPLPVNVQQFSVFHFDLDALVEQGIEYAKLVRERVAPDAPTIDEFLEQGNAVLGFDPIAGLIKPLGTKWAIYTDSQASLFIPNVTAVVSVDEGQGKTLAETLQLIQDKAKEALANDPTMKVQFRSKQSHGRDIHTIQPVGVPFTVSWFVDDKYFGLSLSPQALESFCRRVDGGLASWKPMGDTAEHLKHFPKTFSSFTYTDPREGIRGLLSLAPAGMSLLEGAYQQIHRETGGEGDLPEMPVSVSDLPTTDDVLDGLFPNLTMGTADDQGFHWYTSSSLPLGFIPGGGGGGASVESVGTIAVLVALLLPAVQQARTAARRTQSKNNLKQIGLALHNYHDTFTNFPSGTVDNGKLKEPEERMSWLVSILPYLEQAGLYQAIDQREGWEDEDNKPFWNNDILAYLNPEISLTKLADSQIGLTHYAGIAGLGEKGPTLPANDPKAGIFAYNRVTKISHITDGTSNTLMVGEVDKDLGPWSRGGKGTIRAFTKAPYIGGPDGFGGNWQGGCHFLLGDGSVRFISKEINPETMEALATMAGGETIGDF